MARRRARAATYEASPNIALVKYWGVRDPALALPFNSSISVTLERLRTRTTVRFDPTLRRDVFRLNGRTAPAAAARSVSALLDRVRSAAGVSDRARVDSRNNFQTASGLASSASGFAALAGAACAAAGLRWGPQRLSQLARFGSGSACRSVFGGFVEWRAGRRADGGDCYARPLFPPGHWPELVDLVAIVAGAPEKAVRSSVAMQATVATSPAYSGRLRELPRRIAQIRRAIARRDARRLFPLVIEECDSFRHVCETTRPSLDYLTAPSRAILGAVRELNERAGEPIAAYTHDAGAHVHVFTLERHVPRVRARLKRVRGIERIRLLRPGAGGRRV